MKNVFNIRQKCVPIFYTQNSPLIVVSPTNVSLLVFQIQKLGNWTQILFTTFNIELSDNALLYVYVILQYLLQLNRMPEMVLFWIEIAFAKWGIVHVCSRVRYVLKCYSALSLCCSFPNGIKPQSLYESQIKQSRVMSEVFLREILKCVEYVFCVASMSSVSIFKQIKLNRQNSHNSLFACMCV